MSPGRTQAREAASQGGKRPVLKEAPNDLRSMRSCLLFCVSRCARETHFWSRLASSPRRVCVCVCVCVFVVCV